MRKYHGRNKMGVAYRLRCRVCGQESIGLKGHIDRTHRRCRSDPKGKWGGV